MYRAVSTNENVPGGGGEGDKPTPVGETFAICLITDQIANRLQS
jgi:hypothetical protein